MDAMYRRKKQKAKSTADTTLRSRKREHAADDYHANVRPREAYHTSVDSKKRIKGNLKQLNNSLVEHPAQAAEDANQSVAVANEDHGAKVVTKSVASVSRVPYAYIFSLFLIAAVLMYVVSLYVQVEEYSRSIDEMESRIAQLKEESTRLEVQLESKYDLDEVERIATQEYGMVVSSTLPKKYISVSEEDDLWQKTEKEEPEVSLFEQIVTGIRTFFGKNEE
ncbi:MAG: hypothetical protein IJC26_08595 [Clostridia bacterium]|nr:hypothetical protein [Clostridia bacterium]